MRYAIIAFLLLAGCAGQQIESTSYSEIAQQYEALKVEQPERLSADIQANCADGLCEVPETTLSFLTRTITRLQDEIELRVESYNQLLDAQAHIEYRAEIKDEQIRLMESRQDKLGIIHTAKQAVTAGVCATLLFAQ